jgi:ABC-type branched-subunit amino acid transport system ATPase component/ABC-type branched-subunit amino acid transport system permease subunit
MLSSVLTFAIFGAASGALYALSAMGIVMTYRGSGVVNFASGAIGMVGAFVFWELNTNHGQPIWVSLIAGVASSALLSFLLGLLMGRLKNASNLSKVVLTLAVLAALQAGASLRYPADNQYNIPSFLPSKSVDVLGAHMGVDRIYLIGIVVVLTVAIWALYRFTRVGLATSAVAENPSALSTLGWSTNAVALGNWTLSGILIGLAAIFLAPITGLSVDLATVLLLPSLAAAVLGNLRSFPLTLLGGLGLGIVQSELVDYVNVTGLGDAVPFAAIILIIVWRGRSLPLRGFIAERLPAVSSGRIRVKSLMAFLIVGIIVIEWALPTVWVGAATTTLIGAIILYSILVLTGYSGQISLAQWAIAGCGALATAQARHAGAPFEIAILAGICTSLVLGLIVGAAALRARGVSLAIASLAFGVCMVSLVLTNSSINGGFNGIYIGTLKLFGVNLDPIGLPRRFAIVCFVLVIIIGLALANLRRGNVGRRMLAVRANERAAAAAGIGVYETKLAAFCYSAAIAGLAGALTIVQFPTALFANFDTFTSIQLISSGVLGSVGYVSGPVVGGLGQSGGVITQAVNSLGGSNVIYVLLAISILTVLMIVQSPDGIVALNVRGFWHVIRRFGLKAPDDRPYTFQSGAAEQPRLGERPNNELRVDHLTVAFGGVKALNDVSFSLPSGEVLGVIGPNGAGKTTLIDAISGFVTPSAGDISLNGESLKRLPVQKRARRGISRSFQSLEFFDDMTVGENILVACDQEGHLTWLTGIVRPGRRELSPSAQAAVQQLDLEKVMASLPGELPYGKRRMAAIARTIASGPKIVLLDEPAAGLDDAGRDELVAVIRMLADNLGVGVFLVEHDVSLVTRVSDRILALDFGSVVAHGDPESVRANPVVLASYLGAESATAESNGHADEDGTVEVTKVSDKRDHIAEESK